MSFPKCVIIDFENFLFINLLQLLGWLVASPFILGTLYIVLLPCFKILVHNFSSVPLSPKKPLNPHSEVKLKVRDVWQSSNDIIVSKSALSQWSIIDSYILAWHKLYIINKNLSLFIMLRLTYPICKACYVMWCYYKK